jgi:hypothetical protein
MPELAVSSGGPPNEFVRGGQSGISSILIFNF